MPSDEPSLATMTSSSPMPVWAKTLLSVSKMQVRSLCAAMSTEREGAGGGTAVSARFTRPIFRMPAAAATTSNKLVPTS